MARRKAPPPTSAEVSPGVVVSVGELVAYHLNGWRYGYIDSFEGKTAKVRPIGPKHGRLVTVPTDDIKPSTS